MSETTSTPADYLLTIDRPALDAQRAVLSDIIDKFGETEFPSVCLFPIGLSDIVALEGILELCDEVSDQANCDDSTTTPDRRVQEVANRIVDSWDSGTACEYAAERLADFYRSNPDDFAAALTEVEN